MRSSVLSIVALACSLALGISFTGQIVAQPTDTVAGFDGGSDDGFIGNAFFEATGGNPGGNAHHFVNAFGMSLRTGGVGEPANPGFLGDYSPFSNITFGVDVMVNSIAGLNGELPRNLGLMLIDRDIQGANGASGIWYTLDTISQATHSNWTHLEVTITDPTQIALPPGWIGFGDEDPNTFEPILPAGASFATVLAGVDELRISTFEPGFFFTFADFDVRLDNISVTLGSSAVPEPGCGILAFGLLLLAGRRRSRRLAC